MGYSKKFYSIVFYDNTIPVFANSNAVIDFRTYQLFKVFNIFNCLS
jgi:hypothetical protein